MPSQSDLDQGGTSRAWARQFLGPTVGWIQAPGLNVFPITTAGPFTIDPSVSIVTVNVAGSVTITLPRATNPAAGAGALPGLFADNAITIVDVGGFATGNPITIKPANVSETIMGLAQIQITINYGGFTLLPNSALKTWNSISP